MNSNYDEVLTENVFFQVLQKDYHDIFLKSVLEGCVICVPRAGSLPKYMLTLDDFLGHILIPSDEMPESHFRTLSGKEVKISNHVVTIEHEVGHQSSTHILFEETFYTQDFLKYKVLCIEQSIEEKPDLPSHCGNLVILKTLRDCLDFLWIEVGNHNIEQIDKAVSEFLTDNEDLDKCSIQTIKDLTSLLYTKCVQIVLKDSRYKDKSYSHTLHNLKVSIETYMLHGIYEKVMKAISTCTSFEDACLNKTIRNLSDIQLRDLGVKVELYDTLPKAKSKLSKINGYSTVLGKIGCLKEMMSAITKPHSSGNIVAADDLLPILIFLVIKTNLADWNAQLVYLKFFRFAVNSDYMSDENSFLITSLEAAIEHVQSGILMGSPSPEGQGSTFEEDEKFKEGIELIATRFTESEIKSNKSISHFFQLVSLGNIEEVKKILFKDNSGHVSYSTLNLCHPLCVCQKCKSLISKNVCETFPTVKSRDDQGLTALHIACMYDKPMIVDYLISVGSDLNASDFNGSTAMHYAAMRGHQNALLLLAHSGANVNVLDNSSNTPLHFCSNNGHEGCVKALIYFCEHVGIKLDINAQNVNGDTPLHHASRWGYVSIVKILLENRADPTIKNRRKITPIDVAHNSNVLKLFSSTVHKKDTENYVRIKTKTVASPSLDFSDECNEGIKNKTTIRVVRPNSTEMLKKVEKILRAIAHGDINLTCFYLGIDIEGGQSPIQEPTNSNSSDKPKCHPLCFCSKCIDPENVETEIEHRETEKTEHLSINVCNSEGFTPLHIASMHGQVELVRLFIEKGAFLDVQTRTKQWTPLMLACQNQRLQIAKILLLAGCNIDLQDHKKNTALHYACHTGNNRLVELLIKFEPDLNLRNFRSKTVLDEAKDRMSLGLIKIIKGEKSFNLNGLSNS